MRLTEMLCEESCLLGIKNSIKKWRQVPWDTTSFLFCLSVSLFVLLLFLLLELFLNKLFFNVIFFFGGRVVKFFSQRWVGVGANGRRERIP